MPLPRPLAGVRVLDLSRALAGPFAGRMLTDLGADVVKIEPPEGDVTRHVGVRRGDQTGYYAQQNAGKRNVCLDLRKPSAVPVAHALAVAADIVIENFRPRVMTAFGLGYATLSAANPRLVMLSISGFGQDGPEAGRAAYAGVLHAESGLLIRQSSHSGGAVSDLQFSFADVNAGLHGLVAALAALRLRDLTGTGQHIDLAMKDSMMVSDDYLHWVFEGREPPPGGGEVWEAGPGRIVIHGPFKWVWDSIRRNLSIVDPSPKDTDLEDKVRLRRAAVADLLASCATWEDVARELDRANLPWGRVLDTSQSVASPTIGHRGSIVEISDRLGGTRSVVQSPYRFSACESGVTGPAPRRGEHNGTVLREWLGLADGEIDDLIADGALLDDRRAEPTGS